MQPRAQSLAVLFRVEVAKPVTAEQCKEIEKDPFVVGPYAYQNQVNPATFVKFTEYPNRFEIRIKTVTYKPIEFELNMFKKFHSFILRILSLDVLVTQDYYEVSQVLSANISTNKRDASPKRSPN